MAVASNKIKMHLSKTLIVELTTEPAVPAQVPANILDWTAIIEFMVPAIPTPKVPGATTREAFHAFSVALYLKAGLHDGQVVDATLMQERLLKLSHGMEGRSSWLS